MARTVAIHDLASALYGTSSFPDLHRACVDVIALAPGGRELFTAASEEREVRHRLAADRALTGMPAGTRALVVGYDHVTIVSLDGVRTYRHSPASLRRGICDALRAVREGEWDGAPELCGYGTSWR
jgi:hypothetical protein